MEHGKVVATVVNDRGRSFAVCLLKPGDRYGRGGAVVADCHMVEFYDKTYAGKPGFEDIGQFVQRYNLYILVSDEYGPAAVTRGVLLEGGVPEWTVTAANVRAAVAACLRALD